MVTRYDISNSILNWIINQVRFSCDDSLALVELESWREGGKKPTFNQIDHISRATHIPLGYFFLTKPPVEETPLLQFRTINSNSTDLPSRNLIDTIDEMEQIIDWTKNYLQSEGIDRNEIVGSMKDEKNPAVIANYIRKVLGLSESWFEGVSDSGNAFKRIRERISEHGILVMMNGVVRNNTRRPLSVEEFRAFALTDSFAPLIFINGADSNNGRLFSLIHEFTHICLGVDNLYNVGFSDIENQEDIEVICNAVASEILVPQDVFRKKWKELSIVCRTSDETIKKLSAYFNCSSVVIARKALDASLISKSDYETVVDESIAGFRAMVATRARGGEYYKTMRSRLDRRFFNMVLDSVSNGKTQYSEAFRLTNTNRNTFLKLAERMYY